MYKVLREWYTTQDTNSLILKEEYDCHIATFDQQALLMGKLLRKANHNQKVPQGARRKRDNLNGSTVSSYIELLFPIPQNWALALAGVARLSASLRTRGSLGSGRVSGLPARSLVGGGG